VGLLREALPASTLVIAIDPGKVSNRVWLSTGEAGEVVPPLSLPVLRPGLEQLHRREGSGVVDTMRTSGETGAAHWPQTVVSSSGS
jgi:hypothetical protein